jgi:hypothetical protein
MKRSFHKALVPTNRELKQQIQNLRLLYARRLAVEMPDDLEEPQWLALEAWGCALKGGIKEWMSDRMDKLLLTKRQWAMVLIQTAVELHEEVTRNEK